MTTHKGSIRDLKINGQSVGVAGDSEFVNGAFLNSEGKAIAATPESYLNGEISGKCTPILSMNVRFISASQFQVLSKGQICNVHKGFRYFYFFSPFCFHVDIVMELPPVLGGIDIFVDGWRQREGEIDYLKYLVNFDSDEALDSFENDFKKLGIDHILSYNCYEITDYEVE
jgi:hypothetical protein